MTKGAKKSKANRVTKSGKNRFKYKFIKKNFNEKKLNSSKNLTQNSTKIKQNLVEKKNETNVASSHIDKEFLCKKVENEYGQILLNKDYKTYSRDYLIDILNNSSQRKNKITSEILHKYGITEEIRNYVFSYFYQFIITNKISYKLYFSSVSIFDNFLINFSEDESNIEKCQKFFKLKMTNQLSEIKIILYMFCCYYISSNFYASESLSLNQILKIKNAEDEVTFDDLSLLIVDIINYGANDIDIVNIYSFIDIYMFKIRTICNLYKNDSQYYINGLERIVHFLASKIIKFINLLQIDESLQALAVIIFSHKICKFYYKVNYDIGLYINQLLDNFQLLLMKYLDIHGINVIINWLQNNWCD